MSNFSQREIVYLVHLVGMQADALLLNADLGLTDTHREVVFKAMEALTLSIASDTNMVRNEMHPNSFTVGG